MDDARRDVDFHKLSLAGAYNFITGGTDNTLADREAVAAFEERWPGISLNAVENAKFLRRVVRYFAEQGIRQILDLGAGKPKPKPGTNVHQIMAERSPGARVVYVEKDPTAHSHARAVWGSGSGTAYVEADVRDSGHVLEAVRSRRLLDLEEPVGILLLAVLHYVDTDPAEVVAPYGG